jgi:hypothetical protein
VSRRWKWILGAGIAAGLAAGGGILLLLSPWAADRVQRETIAMLEARFDARVSLGDMSLSLFPRVTVSGRHLSLTRNDDVQPFLAIGEFAIAGSPLALLRRSVSNIELTNVEVRITRGQRSAPPARTRRWRDARVERIHVTSSTLWIIPDNPEKVPLEFLLHEVTLRDFSFDEPAQYTARLTNPKPEGTIRSEGRVGPWDTLALRQTPLAGTYQFDDAKLDTIKGIGGTLTSTGQFNGILERIDVTGTTSSPDFQLQLAQQPVPLDTRFSATVDGTSGDTQLHEVEATLGDSHIVARGSVAAPPGLKKRTVSLQVTSKDARLEDFLRLVIKGAPPMRGALDLDTQFELPPGEEDVPVRLDLAGRFTIRRGQFASDTVQDKVDELSRRGQGRPGSTAVNNVLSAFSGTFRLRKGVLTLPQVSFAVNGAQVALDGRYTLQGEAMQFQGDLLLDAPLSRTVTGYKSVLLRAIDPLFRRGGTKTRLPIRIAGTIDKPEFKLDVGRVLKRK